MMNAKPSPVSAPTLYSSTLLHAYPRVTALPDSIYNPAAYVNAQGYLPFATPDSSAFYSPLNSDCSDAWRALSAQTAAAAAWVYEPSMVGYPYPASYGSLDVRRKNATRESTSTLKGWLYDHIKNPYPTKGEKIMLAIITKMTLTQVSTWFANARRRLKKENKMQWSPRNRTGDDDDDDDDKNSDNDDVIIGDRSERAAENDMMNDDDDDEDIVVDAGNEDSQPASLENFSREEVDVTPGGRCSYHETDKSKTPSAEPEDTAMPSFRQRQESTSSRPEADEHRDSRQSSYNIRSLVVTAGSSGSLSSSGGTTKDGAQDLSTSSSASEKPRIWSLADVATSSTPPSGNRRSPGSETHPKANDLLCQPRYAQDIPLTVSVSLQGPMVHHSFQPWTKRMYLTGSAGPSSAHSVHPFASKLLPGYVSYQHAIALNTQHFRQDQGLASGTRSQPPTTGNAIVSASGISAASVVSAVPSSIHHLDFVKMLPNGFGHDVGKYSKMSVYSSPSLFGASTAHSASTSSHSSPVSCSSSSSSSTSLPIDNRL